MPLLIEGEVRLRARGETRIRTAATILNEHIEKQASVSSFDIFLSHAYDDKELILGVALTIQDLGYSVYLDWRDDPSLDRKNVTGKTAEVLRTRLKSSKCLFYSVTESSPDSKWMPWELGFKDGNNTRVAILPVSRSDSSTYSGQQYLSIYPYINRVEDTHGKMRLWVHRRYDEYVTFDSWLRGGNP